MHKEKKVVLVPLSSKDILASDVARRKREDSEKRKYVVPSHARF
jgi:hypothetical protein